MEQILLYYYDNNAKRLRKMVDGILAKFGGLSDKDTDDFYSLANEVFVDAMKRYDNSQLFGGFLYSCLLNKIKTEITRRNREKRKADKESVSIDAPIDADGDSTIADIIVDSFDMEKEVFEKDTQVYNKKTLEYLARLSCLQKRVLKLVIAGYLPKEIRKELHIDEAQYADCHAAIHSYRNVSVLF